MLKTIVLLIWIWECVILQGLSCFFYANIRNNSSNSIRNYIIRIYVFDELFYNGIKNKYFELLYPRELVQY